MIFLTCICRNVGSTCRVHHYLPIKKSCHLKILAKGMQWYHWWSCWHYIMPMPAPMVSCVPEKSHWTSFQWSWPVECSGDIDSAAGVTWCQHHYQCCYWLKGHVVLHFSCWPKECNTAIICTIGIIWQWYQNQWHHMTKKVMLQLISVVLTWGL